MVVVHKYYIMNFLCVKEESRIILFNGKIVNSDKGMGVEVTGGGKVTNGGGICIEDAAETSPGLLVWFSVTEISGTGGGLDTEVGLVF